jgi:hypothetical protein
MSKLCTQVLAATDVSIEDHNGREWPKLVAYCTLDEDHAGKHAYGPWIDPATGLPLDSSPDKGPE